MSAECPEFGQGLLGVPLLCDRPYLHDGDHHDPATDARWLELPPASDLHASVSPEQTPSPAAESAHRGDHSTVGETP